MIPYGRQTISEADIEAVVKVLRSDYLTQGPVVKFFEETVAEKCSATFGVAVNSATSALHIACRALDLSKGDWLWTSPNTFVASSNCGLYCGARVDFVDIEAETGNMDVLELADKLIQAEKDNCLPKIVIPVHFSGQPCDMAEIYSLAKRYGFAIIEDASHAIGARYQDDPTGACTYSDITIFSFHPVKVVTSGEGGMALTNNEVLAEKMALLRSHGITKDASLMTGESHGPWHYQQIELGYNYRMSDIHAALGLSQLQRLESFVEQRHGIASYYDKALAELPVHLPLRKNDRYSSLHLYVMQLAGETNAINHGKVFESLRESGIGVNLHYIPVHTQPWYAKMGFVWGDFPIAENYYRRAISLPIFPDLSRDQQDMVINTLQKILQ